MRTGLGFALVGVGAAAAVTGIVLRLGDHGVTEAAITFRGTGLGIEGRF